MNHFGGVKMEQQPHIQDSGNGMAPDLRGPHEVIMGTPAYRNTNGSAMSTPSVMGTPSHSMGFTVGAAGVNGHGMTPPNMASTPATSSSTFSPNPGAPTSSYTNGHLHHDSITNNATAASSSSANPHQPPPHVGTMASVVTTSPLAALPHSPQQQRTVKRPRPVKSCAECRKRKLRCDRISPCSQCQKSQRQCTYDAGGGSSGAGGLSDSEGEDLYVAQPQPPPPQQQHQHYQDVPRPLKRTCTAPPTTGPSSVPLVMRPDDGPAQPQPQHPPMLRNGSVASLSCGPPPPPPQHAASAGESQHHHPGAPPDGVLVPTTVLRELQDRLGRLERTVAIQAQQQQHATPPGFAKSPAGTESSSGVVLGCGGNRVVASPGTIRHFSVKNGGSRTRFFGQSSPRVLLSLFDEARDFMDRKVTVEGTREYFMALARMNNEIQEAHRRDLTPISVYANSLTPIQKRMSDILPQRAVCDRLLETYLGTCEAEYRVIHIPSFRSDYRQFWEGTLDSNDHFLPLLLCILSMGSRFESQSKGLGHRIVADGVHIPTAYALVRAWLDSLRGKRLVEIYTLQTEILLLQTQRMISQRQQDSWTQLAFIVRMAMTMGMHREPSEFGTLGPFCQEMRRRIWYTILDMDLHVSLTCNLPCVVREGDYTTRPPKNIDDDQMWFGMDTVPEAKPIDQYTDCQLQAYASRTLLHRMKVVNLLCRIDSTTDYQEVLELGNKLEGYLEDINYLFPRNIAARDRQSGKRWRINVILDIHCRRPLLALYRPFALMSGPGEAPPQILRSYLRSSMTMLGYVDDIDQAASHYEQSLHLYHVFLKHDIIQAAFSICYYIKIAQESARGGAGSSSASAYNNGNNVWGLSPPESSAASNGDYGDNMYSPDSNWLATSPQRLTSRVQRTLDMLVARMLELSVELKEVAMLAVVFASVRAASSGEDLADVVRSTVGRILDAYPRSLSVAPTPVQSDGVGMTPQMQMMTHPPPTAPVVDTMAPSDFYVNNPDPPAQFHGNPYDAIPDFPMWDMDFWNQLISAQAS